MGIVAIGVAFGFRAMEKPEHLKVASLTMCDDEGSTLAWIGEEKGYGRILLYNQYGDVFWSTPPSREAISIEKISKMNLKEVQVALAKVAEARMDDSLDAESSKRLKEEFRMLLLRMKELRQGK